MATGISSAAQTFRPGGGSGSVKVFPLSGGSWTAKSNASWISISSGHAGRGKGAVYYSVAANKNLGDRTGTLTIAGRTVTIRQSGTMVTIDPVATPTNKNVQKISGTVKAGARVHVATDTAASDGPATVAGTTWSYTITGLAEGINNITVTATDSDGRKAAKITAITYDKTPPAFTLNHVITPTNINRQKISGTVEAGATVYVSTDNAASDGPATVTGTTWSYTITGLASGYNNITASATDKAGNKSTKTSIIFYVEFGYPMTSEIH